MIGRRSEAAGRTIQAVAGLSGGFLYGEALGKRHAGCKQHPHGSMLGAAGIMVFDEAAATWWPWPITPCTGVPQSCGKCFCRIGTQRLTEQLNGEGPTDVESWLAEVTDLGRTMKSGQRAGWA
ncbi:MAG: hypothetical protein R2911_09485 [Caldilineaceae bacterium]